MNTRDSSMPDTGLCQRYGTILSQIRRRLPASAKSLTPRVTLVAVSKTQKRETVSELLALGHRVFGENRVQEAYEKWPELKLRHPDCELHLIGSLQTNKVREAVALFNCIQTLDRPKLADALAKEEQKAGKKLSYFIQVNTGEEEQKAGITPTEADNLIAYCKTLDLNVTGLMCIPPVDKNPSPHFALLAKIAARNELSHLSMGMSSDYEIAIRLGATHVRIGSALFGERD